VLTHEQELVDYSLNVLGEVPDLTIYGPKNPRARGGAVAFNFGDIHPHDLGTILDHEGVAIRAGHHCCQTLMRRLDVAATARASFYVYNTLEEIDALVKALHRASEVFGGVAG
jgi:cysteine desulfurase / selenocysteine lyase